ATTSARLVGPAGSMDETGGAPPARAIHHEANSENAAPAASARMARRDARTPTRAAAGASRLPWGRKPPLELGCQMESSATRPSAIPASLDAAGPPAAIPPRTAASFPVLHRFHASESPRNVPPPATGAPRTDWSDASGW